MSADQIGAAFVLVVSVVLGASHLAAGVDPYRNFVTQLVFGWYEAHSPYEGTGLRTLLKVAGVFWFAFASALAVLLFLGVAG